MSINGQTSVLDTEVHTFLHSLRTLNEFLIQYDFFLNVERHASIRYELRVDFSFQRYDEEKKKVQK